MGFGRVVLAARVVSGIGRIEAVDLAGGGNTSLCQNRLGEAMIDLGLDLDDPANVVRLHRRPNKSSDGDDRLLVRADVHVIMNILVRAALHISSVHELPPIDRKIARGAAVIDMGQRFFHTGFAHRHRFVPDLGALGKSILVADQRQIGRQHQADQCGHDEGNGKDAAAIGTLLDTHTNSYLLYRITILADCILSVLIWAL